MHSKHQLEVYTVMKFGNIVQLFCVILFFLSGPAVVWSQSSEQDFEGVWIRRPDFKEFDPFAPDFAIVEKIGRNYLVIFVNSNAGKDGDKIMDTSYHHFYRFESSELVSRDKSTISTIRITPMGELFELIEVLDVAVMGENYYVRPTMEDFQSMIESEGYQLEHPIY